MKILYLTEAISKGGRAGSIQTSDHLLDITLGNPGEPGAEQRGPSPELLFAGAYAACFHGAFSQAAKKLGIAVQDSTVRACVSLIEETGGGYCLGVELHACVAGVPAPEVLRIMQAAHETCPYSKALRGETTVKLRAG